MKFGNFTIGKKQLVMAAVLAYGLLMPAEVCRGVDVIAEEVAAVSQTAQAAVQKWMATYEVMEEAGRHWHLDEYGEAAAKYREAIEGFRRLAVEHPAWKPELVAFRLAYCRMKLADCEEQLGGDLQGLTVTELRRLLMQERERTARLEQELQAARKEKSEAGVMALALEKARQETAAARKETAAVKEALSASRFQLEKYRRLENQWKIDRTLFGEARQVLAEVLEEKTELQQRVSECEQALAAEPKVEGTDGRMLGAADVQSLQMELAACRLQAEKREEASRMRETMMRRALAGTDSAAGGTGEQGVLEAARYWHRAAEQSREDVGAALLAAGSYWLGGERGLSRRWQEQAFARLRPLLPLWLTLGRASLLSGDYVRAQAFAGLAVAVAPRSAEALLALGCAYLGSGETVTAEACLRRALAVSPGHGEALLNMAVLLSAGGEPRWREGKACYEAALAAGQAHDAELDRYYGLVVPAEEENGVQLP